MVFVDGRLAMWEHLHMGGPVRGCGSSPPSLLPP